MRRLLIIEDDNDINRLLADFFSKEHFQIQSAFSGTEAMLYLERQSFDMVLLDLMLPGMTGEEILAKIRATQDTPVIVISAKDDKESKLYALRIGADDYVTKPFDLDILLARVETNLRRSATRHSKQTEIFQYKDILLDQESRTVNVANQPLKLTGYEFDILALLMTNPQKVFTKGNIFESIWQEDSFGDEGTVSVHISHLRTKLGRINPDAQYIETVWGIGFKLCK